MIIITSLPGGCAVSVQRIEVLAREQLAPVHARLNGAHAAEYAYLFDVAHERYDVEPLELGVDGMQATDQVLKEQFERLRQAQHRVAGYHERGHFLATVLDQLALVGGRVSAADRRRAVV